MFLVVYNKFKPFANEIFLQGLFVKKERTADGIETLNEDCWEQQFDGRVRICRDMMQAKGPIGGIYSALAHSKYDRVFIIGADMPYVDTNVLLEMRKHDQYLCVVPIWRNGYLEPLCAMYSKQLLPFIEESLGKKIYRVSALIQSLPNDAVKWLDVEELIETGTINQHCFHNINSFEDILD